MTDIDRATRAKLRRLAADIGKVNAEIAAAEARKAKLVEELAAAAPWPADDPDRDHAFVEFPGLATVRRVWVKGRLTFSRAKAIERWPAAEVDACYDEGPETSRVQVFPAKEEA